MQKGPALSECNESKGFAPILVLVGILVIIGVAGGAYYFGKLPIKPTDNNPKACTQEAKQCPDGSFVGRTGPNCEFSPCPSVTPAASDETANWKIYTGKYFTFKYPMSWKLDSNQDISASLSTTRSALKQSTGDYTPGMAWLTFDITDDSVQKAINSVAGVEKKEQINIDNVSGTKIIGRSGVAGSVYFVTLIMSHKNGSLRVNLSTQDSDLEAPLTSELAKILSTFKFSDQTSVTDVCSNKKTYRSLEDALKEPDKVCYLDLSRKNLTEFPKEILQFENLKDLYLNLNKLTTLPEYITNLKNLTSIDLTGNPITIEETNRLRSLFPKINILNIQQMNLPQ